MTRLLIIGLLMGTASLAQAQANAIEKYFTPYLDDDRFTVVYISPRLFKLFEKMDIGGLEDKEAQAVLSIAKDLKGLRILSTDVTPDDFYRDAKKKINTKEYEILMTVRNKQADNVEFLVKENLKGNIEELLLMIGGNGQNFTLISFVGDIDVEKISRLAKEFDN